MIQGILRRTGFVAAAVGAIAAIASTGVGLAAPTQPSYAYQEDAAHDGFIADAGLSAPLGQEWSITLPSAVSYPLIVDGMVFVTTADDTLYALNQATGSTVWSHGVGGVYGAPGLAYDGGQIYVVNSSGLLTAFDAATGSIVWSTQLPGQSLFTSAPTALNGIAYTGGAGTGGSVYAVRESDGRLLWGASVENGDESSPAVDANGVYVSYACQQAYGFDPLAGTLLWHHDSSCEGGGGETPVLADGNVFVRDGVLGNILLSASTGAELGPFDAGPPPAVADDVAFMLSGSTLTAVTNAGLGVNSWQFSGDSHLDTAPLVAGSLVFEGSSQGNLYALDAATGSTEWSTNVGSPIAAPGESPLTGMAAANGTLIVPAGDELFAYGDAGSIEQPPINEVAPTISGTAQVGETLTADPGTWSNGPSGYRYQWKRCDSAGTDCTSLAGAQGTTYAPTGSDVGKRLAVEVVAVNAGGDSAPADSDATPLVIAAPPQCHVPKLLGLKVAAAKTRIHSRHCSIGWITKVTSKPAKRGRVLSQIPRAGRTLAEHAPVNLKIGKG